MTHAFISRRASNAKPLRIKKIPENQPVKLAEFTSMCVACHKTIHAGVDMIVRDFTLSEWVHDGRGCRSNDTLVRPF